MPESSAPGDSPPAEAERRARLDPAARLHLLILSAVAFALYAYTLGSDFVVDDHDEVLGDPLIRSFAHLPAMFAHGVWFFKGAVKSDRYYRPLKLVAYSVEYRLFGFHPSLWHLANIVFYIATVIAIYFLVRDLCVRASVSERGLTSSHDAGAPAGAGLPALAAAEGSQFAFWTALFFAFHPIHVEAVAWVAAGNDLGCGLMLVLSVWLYHRARSRPRSLWLDGGSVLLFLAGLLFKESALTFPAVILAYDFFYRGESLREMLRRWPRYLAYFAALAGYLVLRVHALHGLAPGRSEYHLTATDMALTVPVVAARYVGKVILPINQNFWYGYEPVRRLGWEPVGAAALVLFLVLAMFRLRRPGESERSRQPLLAFGLAWFWIFLVPVLDISKTSWLLADHYLYIPSLGFCVFAAWGWRWLRRRASSPGARRAVYACLAALLAFDTVVIARRLPDWHDDFRLLITTARQDPDAAPIATMAGTAYVVRGEFEQALPYLERAIALAPESDFTAMAYTNLGMVYFRMGRRDEAIRAYQKAIQLVPNYPRFWTNLAIAYRRTNQAGKAIETCQRGLARDPNDHALLVELGLAEWQAGEGEQALATFRRAIALEPAGLDAYVNLASVLAQQRQFDSAIDQLLAGLAANPQAPDAYMAHFQLGIVYQAKGLEPAAAQEYRRALELQPGFAPARARLESLEASPARP